jgi:hypothetical protein
MGKDLQLAGGSDEKTQMSEEEKCYEYACSMHTYHIHT